MKTDHYRKAIAIYLRGKALDPHAVTAALGVHPSYSQQRGEPWGPPTLNCSEPARFGLWSLRVESDWGSVSDGVTRLLAALPADRSVLRDVEGLEDPFLEIFVAGTADDQGRGTVQFDLSTDTLAALASTGLPVTLCVIPK